MIDPYAVVAVSPRTFTIERREQALDNVKRICGFIDTASTVAAWEGAPTRLVVIPEMAIQGLVANVPGNRAKEAQFAMEIRAPRPTSSVARPRSWMPTLRPSCTWCATRTSPIVTSTSASS